MTYTFRSAKDFLNAFEELYQQSPIPQLITPTLGSYQQNPAPLVGHHANIKAIFDQMKLRRSTSMSISSDFNTTSTTVADTSSGETASRGPVLQNEVEARKKPKEKKSLTTETNAVGACSESNPGDLASCAADQCLLPIPQSPALQANHNFAKYAAEVDGRNQTETPVSVPETTSVRRSPRKSFAQRIANCLSGEDSASVLKTKRSHHSRALSNSKMNHEDGSTLADVPSTAVEKLETQRYKTVQSSHRKQICNSDSNSNSWGARRMDETESLLSREDQHENCDLQSISNGSLPASLPVQGPVVCNKKTAKAERNKRQTGKTVGLESGNSVQERIRERDKHRHTSYEISSQKETMAQSSVESRRSPDLCMTSFVTKTSSVVADKQESRTKADEETLQLVSKLVERLRSVSDSDSEDFLAEDLGQTGTSSKTGTRAPIGSACEMRNVGNPSTKKTDDAKEREKHHQTEAFCWSRKEDQNNGAKSGEFSQKPETRSMLKQQAMAKDADTRRRKSVQNDPEDDSKRRQQGGKTHHSLRPRRRPAASSDAPCDSTQSSSTQMLAVNSQKDTLRLDTQSPEQSVDVEDDAIFAFNKFDSKEMQCKRTAELLGMETKTNNPQTSHLENDKKSQSHFLMLRSWSLQPAPKLNGVRVEGKLPNAQYYWCTSVISKRISNLTLQSANGTVYRLVGQLSQSSTVNAGFSKQLAATFRHGFPENWKELILADMEAMNVSRTETKTNSRTRRTKNGGDGSAECSEAEQQMCTLQFSVNKQNTKLSTPVQHQNKDHLEGSAIWTPRGIISREMDATQVKRTHSGRCVIPPLARWAGQYSERDADGNVTIGFSSLAAENHFAKMVEMCVNAGGESSGDLPRHKDKAKNTAVKEKGTKKSAKTTKSKLHPQAAQQCVKDNIEKKENEQSQDCTKATSEKCPHRQNSDSADSMAILVDLDSAEEAASDVDNMGSDLLDLVKKSAEMRKRKLREKITTCYSQADTHSRSLTNNFDLTDEEEPSTVDKVRQSRSCNPHRKPRLTDKSNGESDGHGASAGSSSDSGEKKGKGSASTGDKFSVLKSVLKPSAPRGCNPQYQASPPLSVASDKTNEYVLGKDEVIFHRAFSYSGEDDDYNKIPNNNRVQNHKTLQYTSHTDGSGSLRQRSGKKSQAKKHDIKPVQTSRIQTKTRLRGLTSHNVETVAEDDSELSDSEQFSVDKARPHRDDDGNSSKVSLSMQSRTKRKRKIPSEGFFEEEKSSHAKKSNTTRLSLADKTDKEAVTKASRAKKGKTTGVSLEGETDEIVTKTSEAEKNKTARVSLEDKTEEEKVTKLSQAKKNKTARVSLEGEIDEEIVTKTSRAKKTKTGAADRASAEVRCWDIRNHPQQIPVQNIPDSVAAHKQRVKSDEIAKSDKGTSRTLRKRLVIEVKENSAVDSSKRQTKGRRLCARESVVIESEDSSDEERGGKGSLRPREHNNIKQLAVNPVETSKNNSTVTCNRESEGTRDIQCDDHNRSSKRVTDGQNARKQGRSSNVDGDSLEQSLKWTKEEIQRLNEAMKGISTDTDHYWEVVSHHVGSRNAEECAARCLQDIPDTKRNSKKSLKTSNALKGGTVPVLQATKGTLKRKQELRAILEHDSHNTNDDLFQSTPFRHMSKRKVPMIDFGKTDEEVFGKNPNFLTPCADGLRKSKGFFSKTPASTRKTPSVSGVFSPLIEKGSTRRKAADQYVFRMQKNRRRLARVFPHQKQTDLSIRPAAANVPEQSPAKCLFDRPRVSELFTITETNASDEDEEQDYYYSDAD